MIINFIQHNILFTIANILQLIFIAGMYIPVTRSYRELRIKNGLDGFRKTLFILFTLTVLLNIFTITTSILRRMGITTNDVMSGDIILIVRSFTVGIMIVIFNLWYTIFHNTDSH